MVSFISIEAYVVMKLKIFKFFRSDSACMKKNPFGCFWAVSLPNIVQSSYNFRQNLSPIRQTLLKMSFKIFRFGSNGSHPKFTVWVQFRAQFTAGKPKVLLKTKISTKITSLEISNDVSSRSQKNKKMLKKLIQK